MSRGALSRLGRLEAAASAAKGIRPWHRIVARSQEEAEAKQAALIASGEVLEGNNFIHRIITGVMRSEGSFVQRTAAHFDALRPWSSKPRRTRARGM
jgi:hypothetical protein